MSKDTFTIKFEDFSYIEVTLNDAIQLLVRAQYRTIAANRPMYQCCVEEMDSMMEWAFKKKPGIGISKKFLEWIQLELIKRKKLK